MDAGSRKPATRHRRPAAGNQTPNNKHENYGINKKKELPPEYKTNGFTSVIVAVLIGAVIAFFNPVNDIFYYAGVILAACAISYTIKDIMHYYNILATRRLPQFDRTGGDDRA